MDWSRAKNILIAVLLVCNIILGTLYVSDIVKEKNQLKELTRHSVEYLEDRGLTVSADIPLRPVKICPVYVTLAANGNEVPRGKKYRGYDIEISGDDSLCIDSAKAAGTAVTLNPAYSALFRYYDDMCANTEVSDSADITDIDLVYVVDRNEYKGHAVEDTALPFWRVTDAKDRIFYYSAIGN